MKRNWFWLILIVCAAAGWKYTLLRLDVVPFNSDEAVVGLMARHILAGELPVFFYGQSYMGSLDAFLVALGFALLGQAVWVIRFVQVILYTLVLLTTVWLGYEVTGSSKIGVLAAGLLAIPTVNVSLYTTISLGGYLEALLIGNLILIQSLRLARSPDLTGGLLWGFLAGLGMWANGLTLVYSLPGLVYLVGVQKTPFKAVFYLKCLGGMAIGGLIGALPWWVYAWQNGFQSLIGELLGSAVSVEHVSWLLRTGMHLVNLVLLGLSVILGLRPPWGITWLALPILPLALVAWGIVLVHFYRLIKRPSQSRAAYALLAGVGVTLFAGFLFTSFGVDPSGRYFLPLAVPLGICAADFAWRSNGKIWLRVVVPVVLLIYQFAGNVQSALAYPPGFTTQFFQPTIIEHRYDNELVRFLKENGELRGYTNYWVAYPLAFLSEEEVIFTPRLPYHQDLRYTARDNRYLPYNQLVDDSQKAAYITTRNPVLDGRLVEELTALGVTWQENWIGDYHIFYALSRPVRPDEMSLGAAAP